MPDVVEALVPGADELASLTFWRSDESPRGSVERVLLEASSDAGPDGRGRVRVSRLEATEVR